MLDIWANSASEISWLLLVAMAGVMTAAGRFSFRVATTKRMAFFALLAAVVMILAIIVVTSPSGKVSCPRPGNCDIGLAVGAPILIGLAFALNLLCLYAGRSRWLNWLLDLTTWLP